MDLEEFQDIFSLDYDKIEKLEGWGKLSANNLKNSIEKSKVVSLRRFIYSLGIRHIGIENAKIIADNIKNISNFIDIIKTENFEKFLNIDGIGQTQINSLKNYFSNKLNVNITIELKSILKIEENLPNESGLLKDKSFMFTGKLSGISRAEAKSLVEKNSGITLSAVSKNLDFLVIGDKPTKRKIDQANDFGIKIIKLNELKKLLDQIN